MAIKEDLSQWEIKSTGKMVSYAFGYIVINYLIGYGWALVFYYYEVEIGLSVMLLGVAMIIFALWNMVNDPLLGFLTDKPTRWTKKWGMRAPWIILTAVPILIFYVLVWTPPAGASMLIIFMYFIQSTAAIWGIRIHAALIPAVIYLIMGLIFKKFYTLEGPEKEAMVAKLKELEIYR